MFARIQKLVVAAAGLCTLSSAQVIYSVSVNSAGEFGNGRSGEEAMSPDGRYVAFVSQATNLVPNDANGTDDVFLHDIESGTTALVSRGMSGSQSAAGASRGPAVSRDGQWVTFFSYATDLVSGDTNALPDIFVLETSSGQMQRISLDLNGAQVAGVSVRPAISASGSHVVFDTTGALVPEDLDTTSDVYRWTRATGVLELVSQAANGGMAGNRGSWEPRVSAEGRFVVFTSLASNLVNGQGGMLQQRIFVRDMQAGVTRTVSVGVGGTVPDDESSAPSISSDGSTVTFASLATNLVLGDTNNSTDVFAWTMASGALEAVSIGSSGSMPGTALPLACSPVSAGGRYVLFQSAAPDVVPMDTNGVADLFLRDRVLQTTERVSFTQSGGEVTASTSSCAMSEDAAIVALTTSADGTLPPPAPGQRQVLARRLDGNLGTNYCDQAPNSTGEVGVLYSSGNVAAAANDVTLGAKSLPPNVFGFFLCSMNQGVSQVPQTDAVVCLGPAIGRLVEPSQVLGSGPSGRFELLIDLTRLPQASAFATVMAGEEWHFQAWHRDSSGGVAASSLTNGLSVTFQ